MKRKESREVRGILLFDKPSGLSSNGALQAVRRLYGAAKAGHTGSLDPLATGLLPICFGEATKIAGLLLGSRKAYEVECRLGVTTDTDDAEGRVLAERPVEPIESVKLLGVLESLTGRIRQVPPVYSALKRDGVPLYRRARRGETVQIDARDVDVHRIEVLETGTCERLRLRVECGSGTYVRSLVRDLGERLGCGAHVTALRRLRVDPFADPAMRGLDELRTIALRDGFEGLDGLLLPLEAGLAGYPSVRVDEPAAEALRHGRSVTGFEAPPGRSVTLDGAGCAVALVECSPAGRLSPVRGFNPPSQGRPGLIS